MEISCNVNSVVKLRENVINKEQNIPTGGCYYSGNRHHGV